MEEGKISTAWAQFGDSKSINVYKMRMLRYCAVAGWDQFQLHFGETSRFTSAIERSGIWKKGR
jgi:hypothetical protein